MIFRLGFMRPCKAFSITLIPLTPLQATAITWLRVKEFQVYVTDRVMGPPKA